MATDAEDGVARLLSRIRGVAGDEPPAPPLRPPDSPDAAARFAIDIQGPVARAYSLAIVNRRLGRALGEQPNVQVTHTALDPQQPNLGVADLSTRCAADATHVIRNTYPPVVDDLDSSRRNYGYLAWEDSRIPSAWAQAFNRSLDGLLVPSAHVRRVLVDSGVVIPVGIVPHGVELAPAGARDELGLDALTSKRFRFLHVSTGFPRKGTDVLLAAFTREFSSRDDVCLILKTLPQYDHAVARQVRWRRRRVACPEIVHLDRELDQASMRRLYESASCFVHPARAEGFGLPVAEAMLAGLPVIVTGYSGPADFCTEETAQLVGYRLVPSRSPLAVPDALWGEPNERELRAAMRRLFEEPEAPLVRARCRAATAHVSQHFTWTRAAERALAFVRAVDAPPARRVRAGMVTTWNECCGIAEYSRALMAAVPPDRVEWSVLAAAHNAPIAADGANVVRCWQNGWPCDLRPLIHEAERRDLDLVHFQTHLNMWGVREAEMLTRLKDEGRRVFMTLHSVRGARPPASVLAVLRTLDRLLVFTDAARERLRALAPFDNVTVLPLGFPRSPRQDGAGTRARLGIDRAPLVGTFGLLRPHKRVLELIHAVARLSSRYPNIGLLALTARHDSSESRDYEQACVEAIDRLGLADRCWLVTDFLRAHECVAALQACDVVALPYRATNDSVSAAVRVALASRRPVLTTRVPVFSDVADLSTQVRGATPSAIARALSRVLDDPTAAAALAARGDERATREGFDVIGRTYGKLIAATFTDLSAVARPYPVGSPVIAPAPTS